MELNKLEKYYNEFKKAFDISDYDSEQTHQDIDELNVMFVEFCEDNLDVWKVREYAIWLNAINKIKFTKWYL